MPLEPPSPFCSRIDGLGMVFVMVMGAACEMIKNRARQPLIEIVHVTFDPLNKTHESLCVCGRSALLVFVFDGV